jgi:hypothetical protein
MFSNPRWLTLPVLTIVLSLLAEPAIAAPQSPESLPVLPSFPLLHQDPVFGEQGQVVFDANFGGSLSYVKSATQSGAELQLRPSLLFFVAPNVAIGGSALVDVRDFSQTQRTFGIGPAAAINIPVGPLSSFLPAVSIEYQKTSVDGVDRSASLIAPSLVLPILFHVTPHFFMDVGARVTLLIPSQSSGPNGDSVKVFSLTFGIGAWK